MKFRRDSDEKVCDGIESGSDEGIGALYGGWACMRRAGHEPPCIAMMGDAAKADGVCFACRAPLAGPHRDDCQREDEP